MQRSFGIFCVSLIVCASLSETIGLVIAAKDKRGWTLNSAGYLLGPRRIDHLIQIKDSPSARGREELLTQYGIDGHRSLGDKPGLAGKRDMGQEEDFRTGALRIADEDIIHTVIDFLSYLKLKGIFPPIICTPGLNCCMFLLCRDGSLGQPAVLRDIGGTCQPLTCRRSASPSLLLS
ncbi:galanin peptides isoform 1-T1 [Synchiropus picturatus]